MRTTFVRQLAVNAGLVVLCFLVLGAGFVSMVYNYLDMRQRTALNSSAQAIAELAEAYGISGNLELEDGMRMSLSLAAEMSDESILICDTDGKVLLCAEDAIYCAHVGQVLPADLTATALSEGSCWYVGLVDGLYEEDERYVLTVPLYAAGDGAQLGYLVVASSAGRMATVIWQLGRSYILFAIALLFVALLCSTFLARSQSRSMKEIAQTVRQYGLGNFDLRLEPGDGVTEEMEDLCRAFNAMADGLAASETQRMEFVANVSHELKTPMTTIGGFVDGMLDGTIPPERHRQYLQAVSDEVRRLSRLVRSMLDVSRLQSQGGVQENKKTSFDICESLGCALLSFEQKINDKGLDVEVEFPDKDVNVLAEKDSIMQVLYNLVDNAVKFCPQGGILRLRVVPEGGKAYISVANSGETIPPEELQLIFDRFHKTDKSRSMDKDGVGLGLYIVRTILASHEEEIAVTSQDGITTFQFPLPLSK